MILGFTGVLLHDLENVVRHLSQEINCNNVTHLEILDEIKCQLVIHIQGQGGYLTSYLV